MHLPLVEGANEPLVLGLLFVIVVLLGVLLSGIPWFKGGRSVLGLFLGLVAGYIVAGMIVRAVTPEFVALVPLPFGFAAPATPGPVTIQPGAGGTIADRTSPDFLDGSCRSRPDRHIPRHPDRSFPASGSSSGRARRQEGITHVGPIEITFVVLLHRFRGDRVGEGLPSRARRNNDAL